MVDIEYIDNKKKLYRKYLSLEQDSLAGLSRLGVQSS